MGQLLMPIVANVNSVLAKAARRYPGAARVYRNIRAALIKARTRAFHFLCRARSSDHVSRYLAENPIPKLQIGSGSVALSGWLNTDKYPANGGICHLDAEKPFPFPDKTFYFIFCEHTIEHLSYEKAVRMLRECFRVLAPGGVLRISTPDFARLIGIYNNHHKRSPMEEKYLSYMAGRYFSHASERRAIHMINNMFYNWGHQFLYDSDLLARVLTDAGFEEVIENDYGESRHEALQGICSHGKVLGDVDLAKFESVILESTRKSA